MRPSCIAIGASLLVLDSVVPLPANADAVTARAGDRDYRLELPAGQCALDMKQSADKQLVNELTTEMHSQAPQQKQASGRTDETEYFAPCVQLAAFRAGNIGTVTQFGMATGIQDKDKYDPSRGALIVALKNMMCGMMASDVEKREGIAPNRTQERIAAAWKRLDEGQRIFLPALVQESSACYSMTLLPVGTDFGKLHSRASSPRVGISTFIFLGDWFVVHTQALQVTDVINSYDALNNERRFVNTLLQVNGLNQP